MFPLESPLYLPPDAVAVLPPPAAQPAVQEVKNVSWTTAASGWQGREAELALQVSSSSYACILLLICC
jgi:hypothetical protein